MNLTKKQKMMLDFIDGFIKGHGYSPTLREIMQALDYKSVSTVAKHVDNLIVRGWLVKREGEARSLVLADPNEMPSPGAHKEARKYIQQLAKAKLSRVDVSDEDKIAIERALEILGLAEVSGDL